MKKMPTRLLENLDIYSRRLGLTFIGKKMVQPTGGKTQHKNKIFIFFVIHFFLLSHFKLDVI